MPADVKTLYVSFSRSGYTAGLEHAPDTRDDVLRFGLPEILSILRGGEYFPL